MVTPIDSQRYKTIVDPVSLVPGTGPVQVVNETNLGDPYGVNPLRVIQHEPISAPAGGLSVANGVYQPGVSLVGTLAADFLWHLLDSGTGGSLFFSPTEDTEGGALRNTNHKPVHMWLYNGTGQTLEVYAHIRVMGAPGPIPALKTYYDSATVFQVTGGENEFDFPNAPILLNNLFGGTGMILDFYVRWDAGAVPVVATVDALVSAGAPVHY